VNKSLLCTSQDDFSTTDSDDSIIRDTVAVSIKKELLRCEIDSADIGSDDMHDDMYAQEMAQIL